MLSGTPLGDHDETEYTYVATDEIGSTAELTFAITVAADFAPSFSGATINDQSYEQHRSIGTVPLPVASGGDGALVYALTPALPDGLSFYAEERVLSGVPTVAWDRTQYTYSVTDEDGDVAELRFTIEVEANYVPSFEGMTIDELNYMQKPPN